MQSKNFDIVCQLIGEITYEMKDLAYCYRIIKVPTDFFSLSADLTRWLYEVERSKVINNIIILLNFEQNFRSAIFGNLFL